MRQVLALQERFVVFDAQESISNGVVADRAAMLRSSVERAIQEARAVAQDNALVAVLVASHKSRNLWGFKSSKHDMTCMSMRTEINGLPVVDEGKAFSFQW